MGNLIYPRTITITRSAYTNTGGGLEPTDSIIATGIAASIQLKSVRPLVNNASTMPAGSASNPGMATWIIIFQGTMGLVKKDDKITDDLGVAYEVDGPWWDSLGYQCECRVYKP